ncbi:capsular exopolysaccharide synthesis family protein [Actinoplanes lutulentus]|uniref:Capsular exopolysaccharide synthesis family protein n=1 Tax=Actinoplanes lutulentus TaxID=1287878 RepID=A0A327ZIN9_9ACTN|nr:polysaccharide biosynthesis tyrosine autokinase [Actinoplanes lutulentus]MBB2944508.1 capsular exopolysaccharide synthesis family protein [Actinoplanes lutulentus]RAK42260.1 capsular exopolysaccharide synthesis family protein [Actinoplanes lutulentus]
MELRAYIRACRRRWLWLLVPVIVAIGVAAGLTLTGPPVHKSSMIVFVTGGNGDPDADARRLNSYIALLTGPRVANGVVDRLGPDVTAEQVQKSLSAQVKEGTDLLQISATDTEAESSRQIVTTAASVLVSLARQIGTTGDSDAPAPAISIVQDAVTVEEPTNLLRNVGFAAVLGLLIGAIAVAIREATAKTVAEEDDLRRLGLGTVGIIALGNRRTTDPDQALAEAFRRLRSLLPEFADASRASGPSGRGRSVLLTGSSRREGTTAVTCGLAIAMAETGARVAVVDANLRTPGLGRYLDLESSRGLAEVLTGDARMPDVLQTSLGGRVTVLPSGENVPDPGEILASPRLGATVRTLTERFDIVLVDSPALHGVADAAVLSQVTDSALLVVRANRTRAAEVEKSMDLLQRVGARVSGAVLNALPRKLPTGKDWHEVVAEVQTGLDSGTGLDSIGLLPDPVTPTWHRMEDTFVSLPPVGPARGRASVAQAAGVVQGAIEPEVPAQREPEQQEPEKPEEEQRKGE